MKRIIVLLSLLFLLLPYTAVAQIDWCEGNFDYDQDVDGTDAFQFKTDFGRSTILNPCPPDGPAPAHTTGQTDLYHEDDDGDLRRGVSILGTRFIDNGDETVTDMLTGLMWTQNARPAGESFTWEVSFDYIAAINLWHYLGYEDWRMPNARELESLVDYGYPFHFNFTPFEVEDYNYYWSSTSYFWFPEDQAFAVLLGDPRVVPRDKTSSCNVWPVRAGH
jgi:hypothetical protein